MMDEQNMATVIKDYRESIARSRLHKFIYNGLIELCAI